MAGSVSGGLSGADLPLDLSFDFSFGLAFTCDLVGGGGRRGGCVVGVMWVWCGCSQCVDVSDVWQMCMCAIRPISFF